MSKRPASQELRSVFDVKRTRLEPPTPVKKIEEIKVSREEKAFRKDRIMKEWKDDFGSTYQAEASDEDYKAYSALCKRLLDEYMAVDWNSTHEYHTRIFTERIREYVFAASIVPPYRARAANDIVLMMLKRGFDARLEITILYGGNRDDVVTYIRTTYIHIQKRTPNYPGTTLMDSGKK
jgi:hypothetical protein